MEGDTFLRWRSDTLLRKAHKRRLDPIVRDAIEQVMETTDPRLCLGKGYGKSLAVRRWSPCRFSTLQDYLDRVETVIEQRHEYRALGSTSVRLNRMNAVDR